MHQIRLPGCDMVVLWFASPAVKLELGDALGIGTNANTLESWRRGSRQRKANTANQQFWSCGLESGFWVPGVGIWHLVFGFYFIYPLQHRISRGQRHEASSAIMFRNPREKVTTGSESVPPSVGRPPTPPHSTSRTKIIRNSSPYFGPTATPTPGLAGMKAQHISHSSVSRTPTNKRKTSVATGFSRTKSQPNQSILNFFAKSDRSEAAPNKGVEDQELFFQEPVRHDSSISERDRSNSETPAFLQGSDHIFEAGGSEGRYNEDSSPVKRRRIGSREDTSPEEDLFGLENTDEPEKRSVVEVVEKASDEISAMPAKRRPSRRQRGPFIEESDSEEEWKYPGPTSGSHNNNHDPNVDTKEHKTQTGTGTDPVRYQNALITPEKPSTEATSASNVSQNIPSNPLDQFDGPATSSSSRPALTREATSVMSEDEFDEMEDFDSEFFEGGEEYMERRYLEEQRMFEEGLDEDSKSESAEEGPITPTHPSEQGNPPDKAAVCPICNQSLKSTTEAEASAHVNGCLDGNPTPLPANATMPTQQHDVTKRAVAIVGGKRFQRAAAARPGQENPFSHSKDGSSGSAFSKLMSGHAEDAAWATAAANEVTSRGKPAYQRTCPFYKIMPGLYICVDAFRYGKVEGQNAYFLSHFHSDHYIGLTSSWCHGPIYCSRATANLVRQQLKVDPKWVVDLEFEKKVEIPGTQGVSVTMLPANHCPGSSLYLFEKVVRKGPNPKTNRILHCGDFRACPAHVNHPLLRPDVVDSISGKTKQQMIDTCYLDTTYLTPKYAFPSQEDVITSCAQMCVSLSKEIPDTNDGWERAKLDRAGSGMTKFLEKGNGEDNSIIKEEEKPEDIKPNGRGRLLVVIGTYSIGKERICLGIAKALNSKIYAPAPKQRICACLEDAELSSLLTTNPLEAQVHMQMLMEIRAETLLDYLHGYKSHFSRVVGFRPTGWNYRPPTGRFTENPAVSTVLHSDGWKSRFTMKDLVSQRGSTRESSCFGVPYSEHSSFRELTMFCCALRIGRVIPTVNVGSAKSREKMKMWVEKWEGEKKKSGLFRVEEGATSW
jgi:DNA cross-link repair 1A protein